MDEIYRARNDVPKLLSLLALSLGEAAKHADERVDLQQFTSHIRNVGDGPHVVGDGVASHGGRQAARRSDGGSRIRQLRRTFDILLFGGASYEEAVEQADAEDSNGDNSKPDFAFTASNSDRHDGSNCNNNLGMDTAARTDEEILPGVEHNELSSVLTSLSMASLQLRRARRYDPANALDGLVDELISRQGHDVLGTARILRLLFALHNVSETPQDADDWEVVGAEGRRVLQRIYSGKSEGSRLLTSRVLVGEQENINLPAAMFFRDRRGAEARRRTVDTTGIHPLTEVEQVDAEDADAEDDPSKAKRAGRNRYLLPDDCILHGDSTVHDVRAGDRVNPAGFGVERMPWFSDAVFSSEQSIPDLSTTSLDLCMAGMVRAPLSPTAWTRHGRPGAAGGRVSPPVMINTSGGPLAAQTGRSDERADTASGSARGGGSVPKDGDLCGAFRHRSGVNQRSTAANELHLTLSFPDLDASPTNVLEAVQCGQPVPTVHVRENGGKGNDSACSPPIIYQGPFPSSKPQSDAVISAFTSKRQADQCTQPPTKQLSGSRSEAFLPAWDRIIHSNKRRTRERVLQEAAALRLEAVGWQRAESGWNDPSMTRSTLAPAPLVTGEGAHGPGAFEVCYREHFGGIGGEVGPPTTTEVEIVRRALAVLQGVPSESFYYDLQQECMRVSGCRENGRNTDAKSDSGASRRGVEASPLRVVGLSSDALESLLGEFALAGTWYRRVEAFAACLADGCTAAGQVSQAFGVELRRQLSRLQAAVLFVTADVVAESKEEVRSNFSDGDIVARRNGAGYARGASHSGKSCSLAGILHRTTEVRRAITALADICGLAHEDLGPYGGSVRTAAETFPRGAYLLTYLYRAAEARAVSEQRGGTFFFYRERLTVNEDFALALLSSAAEPYLSMLSRWLWLAEMQDEDDPYEEFPLRCRDSPTRSSLNDNDGNSWAVKAPWMRDGGSSFMTEAFHDNVTAGVPCFLGEVLAAASRAGKMLRILKLSSPEFFASCSASPPPPLSLVFDSGALEFREAVFARLALLQEAGGRSSVREIRIRVAEEELRTGTELGGTATKQIPEDKISALRMLELRREEDRASVREARRIWGQGLNTNRSAAVIASTAAGTAAFSSKNTTDTFNTMPGREVGKGMLYFLEPPTSEAEERAAAALRERYRLLGEEADARAARARWMRRKSERARAAHSSLQDLYAAEAQMWANELATAKADPAAGGIATGDRYSGTGEIAVSVHAENVAIEDEHLATEGVDIESVDAPATVMLQEGDHGGETPAEGDGGTIDKDEWVQVELLDGECKSAPDGIHITTASIASSVANPAQISAVPETDRGESQDSGEVQGGQEDGSCLGSPQSEVDAQGVNNGSDDQRIKFSHVRIVKGPGGNSAGAARALGGGRGNGENPRGGESNIRERGGDSDDGGRARLADKDPPLKFSHVHIVEEPGGSSSGISQALCAIGVSDDRGGDTSLIASTTHGSGVRITQDPGGNATGVSRAMTHDPLVVGASDCDLEDGKEVTIDANNIASVVYAEEDGIRHSVDGTASTTRDKSEAPPDRHAQDDPVVKLASTQAPAEPARGGTEMVETLPPSCTVQDAGVAVDVDRSAAERAGLVPAGTVLHMQGIVKKSVAIDVDARKNQEEARAAPEKGSMFISPQTVWSWGNGFGGEKVAEKHDLSSSLPLEVLVRRCVKEPVLAQCRAVDAAALAFLVRGAGAVELLASLRIFLLGLNSGFLHNFTLRLLEGLHDGGVNWRRPSNLEAAFAASAAAAGLESVPLFDTFRYEVDLTCGGVLGGGGLDTSSGEEERHSDAEEAEGDLVRREDNKKEGLVRVGGTGSGRRDNTTHAALDNEENDGLSSSDEFYSSTALSFVSPVLTVAWPLGLLLPTGALRTYGKIHRAVLRHHLGLHRLRRLRLVLRDLDVAMEVLKNRRQRVCERGARGGMIGSGRREQGATAEVRPSSVSSWDCGRLHWVHLFRHEMQHVADSIQSFFAEQAEAGWPDLRRSLASSSPLETGSQTPFEPQIGVPTVGGLAVLLAAHSKYISEMERNMFLGSDRPGVVARARIEEFYEVVCTVGRVTDGLAEAAAAAACRCPSDFPRSRSATTHGAMPSLGGADGERTDSRRRRDEERGRKSGVPDTRALRDSGEEMSRRGALPMIIPDRAFSELVAARERFDAARRGLCGALLETIAAGGSARARPLLAVLDYGGHENTLCDRSRSGA